MNPLNYDDVEQIMEASLIDEADPFEQLAALGIDAKDIQEGFLHDPDVTNEQTSATLGGILIGYKLCQLNHNEL